MTNEKINRRDIIQSGAAFGGISLFNFQDTRDENLSKKGEINLTELVVIHTLPDISVSERYPTGHHDGFVRYIIDENSDSIIPNRSKNSKLRNDIGDIESIVVTSEGELEIPSTIYGNESIEVPLLTGSDGQVSKSLVTQEESPYEYPSIDISKNSSQGIEIRVEDVNKVVSPGEQEYIVLNERTAIVTPKSDTVNEVQDPRNPGETTPVRVFEDPEDVTVIPRIIIRNYGRMNVLERP